MNDQTQVFQAAEIDPAFANVLVRRHVRVEHLEAGETYITTPEGEREVRRTVRECPERKPRKKTVVLRHDDGSALECPEGTLVDVWRSVVAPLVQIRLVVASMRSEGLREVDRLRERLCTAITAMAGAAEIGPTPQRDEMKDRIGYEIAYAMEWSEAAFCGAAFVEVADYVLAATSSTSASAIVEFVRREVLRAARFGSSSTSPASNEMTRQRCSAWATLDGRLLWAGLSQYTPEQLALAPRVKEHA